MEISNRKPRHFIRFSTAFLHLVTVDFAQLDLRTETGDVATLDFGRLPEQCCRQLIVTLVNRGSTQLPLRIAISDGNSKSKVFTVADGATLNETRSSRQSDGQPLVCLLKAGPQQKLHLLVSCDTPSLQLFGVPRKIRS